MKRFFKHVAESDLGAGSAFLEVTDGWPTRQVEVYGQTWRTADQQHPEYLADQPLTELGLSDEDEMEEGDFEAIWAEVLARCPQLA